MSQSAARNWCRVHKGRTFPVSNAAVRLSAAAVVFTMFAMTTSSANETSNSKKIIPSDCIDVLTSDGNSALVKLKRGKQAAEVGGEPVILLPGNCLVNAVRTDKDEGPIVVDDPKPRPKENFSATVTRANLKDLVKGLESQGVPPTNLVNPQGDVDGIIGRNERKPDVRGPLVDALEENKSEDAANTAILGFLTAGCMGLGGGPICAILVPELFGELFKGKVTKTQIEGGSRVARKFAAGEALDDKDYDVLKDLGAKDWATKGLRALQTGKYEEFVTGVAKNNGVPESNTITLRKLAKIAETGEVTCAILDGVIRTSFAVDAKTRQFIEDIAIRSRKSRSAEDISELKKCLNQALAGGG